MHRSLINNNYARAYREEGMTHLANLILDSGLTLIIVTSV